MTEAMARMVSRPMAKRIELSSSRRSDAREGRVRRLDVIGINSEKGKRTGPLPLFFIHDRFKVDLIQRKCKSVAMVVSADRRYSSTRS